MNWLPPLALGFWGAVLLQAWSSGRLNLLLQADFHWLVLVAGLLLLALALLALRFPPGRRSGQQPALIMLLAAPLMLALPPKPSLSTLAANRSSSDLGESDQAEGHKKLLLCEEAYLFGVCQSPYLNQAGI